MLDTTRDQIDRQDVSDAEAPLHRALGILNAMVMAFESFGECMSEADSIDALTHDDAASRAATQHGAASGITDRRKGSGRNPERYPWEWISPHLFYTFNYHCPHPASSSPTTRRSILLINSALCASAAFMAVVVCFKVLVFDPPTTVPPITAANAPIMTVGSNPTAPMIIAKLKVPPAAMANFEIKTNFRQLSITSASSSMWASMCKISSCRSPSSSMSAERPRS